MYIYIVYVTPLCYHFSKTRFRWIQESSTIKNAPAFGLDGVYISEPCPNYCNGHGDCISGVCFCDRGYTGNSLTAYQMKIIIKFMYNTPKRNFKYLEKY